MGEKYMSYFVSNEYHMIDQTVEENRSYTNTFKNCIARATLHHQEFAICVIQTPLMGAPIFALSHMSSGVSWIYDPNTYDPSTYQLPFSDFNSSHGTTNIIRECSDEKRYMMLRQNWANLIFEWDNAKKGTLRIAELYMNLKQFVNSVRSVYGSQFAAEKSEGK